MTRTHAQLLRENQELRKQLEAQTRQADMLAIKNTMLQREIMEMRDCQQRMARRREEVL